MRKPIEQNLASLALLFAALGDETRLLLLKRLSQGGPASISVLAERFQLTRQGVTKHLEVLAAAQIIEDRRDGRERIWKLNASRLQQAIGHLEVISQGWDDALARLKALVENEQ